MRPLILITNDDGIYSPGLKAVAEAVAHLGDLLIAAPRYQQTAMGRSLPRTPNNGIIDLIEMEIAGSTLTTYGIHGSPANAVRHGVCELAPRQPDLCLSGINYGENIGATITSSGTVGAALEAAGMGIPAIAMSMETDPSAHFSQSYPEQDWSVAAEFASRLATMVLRQGLGQDVQVLNVNVPLTATPETPMRPTIQSRFNYYAVQRPVPKRDFSQPFLLPDKAVPDASGFEPNSDAYVFAQERAVSVTPLIVDLTARTPIDAWFDGFLAETAERN